MFNTNEYFDGNVISIAFQGEALPATVGVMAAGEYEFSTSKKELMTVISGVLTVKLPNENQWRDYSAQQSFTVDANSSFQVRATSDVAYLCIYKNDG